jgi:hypothetical protein
MALSKPFDTKFGITANYHKLLKVEIGSADQMVQLTVAVYATQEAKDSGAQPIWYEYVKIPFNRLNFDPREAFYPLLKEWENSYLRDAEDSVQSHQSLGPPVFHTVEPPPETKTDTTFLGSLLPSNSTGG